MVFSKGYGVSNERKEADLGCGFRMREPSVMQIRCSLLWLLLATLLFADSAHALSYTKPVDYEGHIGRMTVVGFRDSTLLVWRDSKGHHFYTIPVPFYALVAIPPVLFVICAGLIYKSRRRISK